MSKPKKILIVEDEKMLRDMYRRKLKQAGFEVKAVPDAEQALSQVKRMKPDLILLDILLPQKNGLDFLGRIREDKETKEQKILAFSNYDDPSAKKQAKKLGVVDYLMKTNFTPAQVVKKVQQYL